MAWQGKPRSPREQFDETNTWTIKKDTRENRPEWSEFTGIINIEGKKYHLNPKRATDAQKPYGILLYGKIKEVADARREDYQPVRRGHPADDLYPETQRENPKPTRRDPDFEDEIPF